MYISLYLIRLSSNSAAPSDDADNAIADGAINAAAADFHRRFHISVDESENRGDQVRFTCEMCLTCRAY